MKKIIEAPVVLALLALGGVAPAEDARPTPAPSASPSPVANGASWRRAGPASVSAAPSRLVVAPVSPAPSSRAELGGLQGAKAIALKEGEATLLVGGSALTLRPGSVIGSDVVKSVGSDRIVLVRSATGSPPAGAATVVVSFDAQGQSRVRVYWLSDPAAVPPREVR